VSLFLEIPEFRYNTVEGSSHAKNPLDLFSYFDRTRTRDRHRRTDADAQTNVHSIAIVVIRRKVERVVGMLLLVSGDAARLLLIRQMSLAGSGQHECDAPLIQTAVQLQRG